MAKSCKNELGADTAGARNSDDPEIVGVLEAAHTGQVCGSVTAPVAEEGSYFGLPIIHQHLHRALYFIDHRHNLICPEPFQIQGAGTAGSYTQPASLAQHRIDLRPACKRAFFDK